MYNEFVMNIFNIDTLGLDSNSLVKCTNEGHLATITKENKPLLITVPFTEEFLKLGLSKFLAIKMLEEKILTPQQASDLAGISLIEMLYLASSVGINIVDYDPKELANELKSYYE
jgi:predicted HTH domain antitoxin